MIRYACAKCRREITDWSVKVTPEGKLALTGKCHGDTAEILIAVSLSGVLFSGRDPYDIKDRNPDSWIDRLKAG